jgi:hypothetical protein
MGGNSSNLRLIGAVCAKIFAHDNTANFPSIGHAQVGETLARAIAALLAALTLTGTQAQITSQQRAAATVSSVPQGA